MPFYDLKCPYCGREEEVMCSYEEAKNTACEMCMNTMEIAISQVFAAWNCDCPTASQGRSIVVGAPAKEEKINYHYKGSPAAKTVDVECVACDVKYEIFLQPGASIRDTCPTCGVLMTEAPVVPVIRDSNCASYIDGTKQEGFAELREANKLERESLNLPKSQRGGYQKEINRMLRSK